MMGVFHDPQRQSTIRGKGTGRAPLNEADNEHIELHDLRGFSADDLTGAFKEVEAISKGTRCTQYLFSLRVILPNINPIEYFSGQNSRIIEIFSHILK